MHVMEVLLIAKKVILVNALYGGCNRTLHIIHTFFYVWALFFQWHIYLSINCLVQVRDAFVLDFMFRSLWF